MDIEELGVSIVNTIQENKIEEIKNNETVNSNVKENIIVKEGEKKVSFNDVVEKVEPKVVENVETKIEQKVEPNVETKIEEPKKIPMHQMQQNQQVQQSQQMHQIQQMHHQNQEKQEKGFMNFILSNIQTIIFAIIMIIFCCIFHYLNKNKNQNHVISKPFNVEKVNVDNIV